MTALTFILMLTLSSASIAADEVRSLSTSNLMPISELSATGATLFACSGKKAVNGMSYVTIASAKQTVNKNDNLLKRIFNTNRRVFATHTLTTKYQSVDYSISKVSTPFSLNGANSSVDISAMWVLANQIPWVVQNTSLKIKLGYSADSTMDALADAFSSVTSAMPSFSLSAGASAGMAVTNSIDKLLFNSGRSVNLLNASLELPLLGDPLCEGYYAAFASDNKPSYEKYNSSTVIWSGTDLKYKGLPISDVSYTVIRVRVHDKYFPIPMAAFSDIARPWTKPYKSVLSELNDLTYITDSALVKEKENFIVSQLVEGRTLLNADRDVIPSEQQEIHDFVNVQARNAIIILKKRITLNGVVTPETTRDTVTAALVNRSALVSESSAALAKGSLASINFTTPAESKKLAEALNSSIQKIERVLD